MPWNGSGTFSRSNGTQTGSATWFDAAGAGNNITTSQHDTHDQDLADGIGAALTKNNETKPTAHFLPNADATYNLGSAIAQWVNAFFSGAVTAATVAGGMVATQAQQETGSATNVLVSPGRQHFHQSASKFWFKATADGAINAGYNMTSVTDVGTGEITGTIANDLSADQYTVVGTPFQNSFDIRHINISSTSVGSFSARCCDSSNNAADPTNWYFVGYGDI